MIQLIVDTIAGWFGKTETTDVLPFMLTKEYTDAQRRIVEKFGQPIDNLDYFNHKLRLAIELNDGFTINQLMMNFTIADDGIRFAEGSELLN